MTAARRRPGAPVMDLVAGPQGSGKSTFFSVAESGHDSFNVDQRRKELNGGSAHDIPPQVRRQALQDYVAFIEGHIADRTSFAIEVTLAIDVTFEQAERARKKGFRLQLTYVAAELPQCIDRVAKRVELGGHGVAAAVIRQTHEASLRNLVRALRTFDLVQVYDGSVEGQLDQDMHEAKPHLVLEARGGVVRYTASAPDWLRSALVGTEYELRSET